MAKLVSDEETGHPDAMAKFVYSEHFRAMNVGVSLDEGLANPENAYTVYYGERVPWCMF